uniref:YdbL family protein n=1 Tax=Candidatus Electrothrix sp. TaxID=2170559 RepID=UPI0040569B7C
MNTTITLFLCGFFTLLLCQPVFALELQDAKPQGLVGETPTGYLDVVKASPEAKQLIKEINAKRKIHYQEIAKKNKTPLSAVEKLAGQKALEKTPAGQFIKVGGKWEKK